MSHGVVYLSDKVVSSAAAKPANQAEAIASF
jgi:uncharacterized caspase-like protein